MGSIAIQFSTCAPPTLRERFSTFPPLDYSSWICRITHSPFSHCDAELPDGNLLGASNNPEAPFIAGNPSGVAIRPPDYQHFAIRRRAVLRATDQQAQIFAAFCHTQLGKPFDSGALKLTTFLSGDFTNRNWRDPSAWFCCELIARAIEVAGLLPWGIIGVKNRITAGDLLLIAAPIMSNVDTFWSQA